MITKDGEILVTGLPWRKGDSVDVIVLPRPATPSPGERLTVGAFLRSGLVGLWQDRDDIADPQAFARRLREQAQNRGDEPHDTAR